jgi:cytochrome c oxidase subunit 4
MSVSPVRVATKRRQYSLLLAYDRGPSMKKEANILNIICGVGALGFLAFAAFNAISTDDFLSTDNLFLTLVCLLFALVFAASPLLSLIESGKLPLPFKKKALPEAASLQLLRAEAAPAATDAGQVEEETHHFAGTTQLFMYVWGGLLVLTGIEVLLGYKPMSLHLMLTILLGLSIIKAALIIAYFMHLKFERLSLILTVLPMLVICICLFFVFFPDSFRSSDLRYKFKEPPPVPAEKTDDQ